MNVFNVLGVGGSHAELFAVIHLRRSSRSQEEHRHELGDLIVVHAVAIAVPLPRLIVIAEEVFRLPVRGVILDLVEELPEPWAESLLTSAIWKSIGSCTSSPCP